ncbi:uncharacterized protein LOC130975624 [Arachis stenosperma]|uniref:uncharacterized protein LOC130975624 n=1 Tax=Arachis stenosperma TaxID=217475 RepID=UPI0025AD0B9B|nr:uncharacterized protein LOC130975624 [Arachis stenosperma]
MSIGQGVDAKELTKERSEKENLELQGKEKELKQESQQEEEVEIIDEGITIVYHDGGSFVTKPNGSLVYDNDHTNELTGKDEDVLDVFLLRDYYKVLGYDNMVKYWWLIPGRPIKSGLRVLSHDKEPVEMCFYAKNNGRTEIPQPKPAPKPTPKPRPATKEKPKSKPAPKKTPKPIPKPGPKPKSTSKPAPQPNPTLNTTKSTSKSRPKPNPTPKSASKPNPTPKSAPKSKVTSSKSIHTATRSSDRLKERVVGQKQDTGNKKTYISLDDSNSSDSDSHDSYESAEDSLYKPGPQDSSIESNIEGGLSAARLREFKLKHAPGAVWKKHKEKIVEKDDNLVVENSDEEVDWVQVLGNRENNQESYDAYDPIHDDSDGNDSWRSEKLKNPQTHMRSGVMMMMLMMCTQSSPRVADSVN